MSGLETRSVYCVGCQSVGQGGRWVGLGTARIVYVVFAFEPYILHECGQCELAARSLCGTLACFFLSVSVCVSFNIIAYLRAE